MFRQFNIVKQFQNVPVTKMKTKKVSANYKKIMLELEKAIDLNVDLNSGYL